MDLWSTCHKLKTKGSDVFEDSVSNALPTLWDIGNTIQIYEYDSSLYGHEESSIYKIFRQIRHSVINDILIHSKTRDEHEEQLRIML